MVDIEKDFYSIKDIIKKWKEDEKSIENGTDMETSVSKKFVYVLKEKLKLEKEEINWFKEKLPNGRERFIFRADSRTPKCIKDILDICGRRNGMLMPSEEYSVIESFAIILPSPVFKSDDLYGEEYDKRAYRIDQAVRAFCKESWVEEFFLRKIFVSIDAELDIAIRKKFYQYQYDLIKCWEGKWSFIMDRAYRIRKAERVECLYMCKKHNLSGILQESIEKFCETGKSENEVIQKAYDEMPRIGHKDLYEYIICLYETTYQEKEGIQKRLKECTKDGCSDACKEPFRNIVTHYLKSSSMKDFEYMIREARKELEIVSKILKQGYKSRKRRELYPKVDIKGLEKSELKKKICEEDLQHLSNIRRHLNETKNGTILILDYM